jgi:CHAT domain-containing protein
VHSIGVQLNLAALLYYTEQDYAKAASLYRDAVTLCEKSLGRDHPLSANSLTSLASVQIALGSPAEAVTLFDHARRILRRHVADVLPSLTMEEQLEFIRARDWDEFHRAITFAVSQPSNSNLTDLSASWVANGKAIAQEATGLRDLLAQAGKHGSEHNALRELRQIRAELAELSYRSDPLKDIAESHERRRALHEEERRLVHDIGGRLALLTREDPWVSLSEVRGSIADNSVLIDIVRFKVFDFKMQSQDKAWLSDRYAAWIIPPRGKGSTVVIDLGDAPAIDAAVTSYRDTVRAAVGDGGLIDTAGESNAEEHLRAAAAALTDKVLTPILAGIRASGCDKGLDELIISPDGELWLVPWAALPLDDHQYLITRYAVVTVTSARDLVASDEKRPQGGAPLIFADPLFDLPKETLAQAIQEVTEKDRLPSSDLEYVVETTGPQTRSVSEIGRVSRLPGTLNEARRIAVGIERVTKRKATTFLQSRALEERIKRVQSPRVLHIATHGFALPDQRVLAAVLQRSTPTITVARPRQGLTAISGERLEDPLLRCGMLLAGCNLPARDRPKGAEDGCLTGKEIVGLDLRGTELVVLSACDTGTGRVQYGEGVAGLRQAFLLAGAEAVLATLWQVPDVPTADLVAGFFDHLAAGKSKANALRQAQLDLIEKRRKSHGAAHPVI